MAWLSEEQARALILREYGKLMEPGNDRSQIYLNIIALKRECGLELLNRSLYQDVKAWIGIHFEDLMNKDYGYDVFRLEPFAEQIELFPPEQSLSLYHFLLHACEQNYAVTEELKGMIERKQLDLWRSRHSWLRFALYKLANDGLWIFFATLMFIALVIVSFLPAPADWMHCIDITFFDGRNVESLQTFSDYLENALFYIMHGETESPIVAPRNLGGVVWVLLTEFAFWGLLINFLYQHITAYLRQWGLSRIDSSEEK